MAERGEVKVITLGGKGSSLSSSSVYAVATGQAQLRNDSSALDRLLSDQNPATPLKPFQFSFPKTFTSIEIRASLTVLLNKFLLHSNPSNIRSLLPNFISKTLNFKFDAGNFDSIDVTEEERLLIEKSAAHVYGVCSILDHESAALASIVDAVAALSCEAAKADVAAFSSMDTGDGFVDKEGIGVAGDMKVLLNGSKFVGKFQSEAFSKVPKINGRLREVVKSLHSVTRVSLNSREEVYEGDAIPAVLALSAALKSLGKISLCRGKMNLEAVGNGSLKTDLISIFEKKCPNENVLRNAYKLVLDSDFEEDTGKFVHEVNALLGTVWSIVAWEGITAFFAIEGGELMSAKGVEEIGVNGGDEKVVKKAEKKKKKLALGKGTSVIVQLIKDRLQGKGGDSGDSLQVLEKWVQDLLLFLDPKEMDFDVLVLKVKEIVESNESRRLPKLPKVINSDNNFTFV